MTVNDAASRETTCDSLLDALGDRIRRRILVELLNAEPNESVRLRDLDIDVDAPPVATQLHHVHLPKLEEMGFIDWNPETSRIVEGPGFDQMRPLLTLLNRHRSVLPDDYV